MFHSCRFEEEEKKKKLEMTSEIKSLRDENSSLHLEMNTLQQGLAEQRIEVENMRIRRDHF